MAGHTRKRQIRNQAGALAAQPLIQGPTAQAQRALGSRRRRRRIRPL